jgi:hypothetical protein
MSAAGTRPSPHHTPCDGRPRRSPPACDYSATVKGAWVLLAVIAVGVVVLDAVELRRTERALIDRRTCLEEPSAHTLELDRSARGDALYRFVYGTLFGLGRRAPRAGFPHLDAGPVCTVGWKDPVAALKIGTRIFLVTLDDARVVSVEPKSPA